MVVLEGPNIMSVPFGSVAVAAGATGLDVVVDLGDVTLLPGLLDTHVHLGFDAALTLSAAFRLASTLRCWCPCVRLGGPPWPVV